ncbi:unnamed protein product [Peronospora belbahrii]|uniref:Protein kinase domain-containing protein n=1 Tax=Peronospora belbahrii TaxID=622444 RepID=A0AAU9L008_9STRA|nr:unnamed protein product [Peronospora belbahrii]CAH0521155.1 unnamed protein product [Peronospora belbahrii]
MGRYGRSRPVIHENGFTINGCNFNVDSKYQPIEAIGQGSYGVVCSVRNTQTYEKLAIKKITPMASDEWDATHTLREIRLIRWLGAHENIISLKDLSMCKEKDELYMMMELADTDLHRLIQSSCLLTEGHIRIIMYQVLSGVKAMHDNGILHRDLKPGNLLLNQDCELKVTDFGLARMMPNKSQSGLKQNSDDRVSMMTEYVVTRWYRPPELMLAPNGSYDGAVDMWSIGCILGELIARKPLFPGTDFMNQLTRVFQVLPVPEPEDRGYTIEKGALKFLSSLPPPASHALEDKLGDAAGPQVRDLLRRLLCFNPKKRISVDDALAHPFFDGIRDEWGEITPLHLPHSLEFAFETQSLPLTTLRQYIWDEVLAFADCSAKRPESKPQTTRTQKAGVPKELTAGSNDTPSDLENDSRTVSGFTLKGCNFNVPAKYKPLRILSESSDGIVCASTDTETRKNVAIKKITPMAGDGFNAKHTLREIRLMRYFGKHPNIVSLQSLSMCIKKDELYLIMDLADTDLRRLIRSKTKIEEAHIAAIMYQLVCGVQTLHENGVLHRDLKPDNILVTKNCDVKITNFGHSRYIPHSDRKSPVPSPISGQEGQQPRHIVDKTQSMKTEHVVARWYRAPEITLTSTGTYNKAVDMWSIGCIFGELLNRRPMFPGADFLDQLSRVFCVLSMPPRNELGYEVESDALAFLDSLPPCSPSALDKLFHHASSEAVSLLRQLLCVNPAHRIAAKQALAHPYFKTIRAQLGEPPVFHVEKVFDFEFDYQHVSFADLKALLQSEVQLLQNDGLLSPIPVHEPTEDAEQQPEDFVDDDDNNNVHVQEADSSVTKRNVSAVTYDHHWEEAKATKARKDACVPTGPENDSEVDLANDKTRAARSEASSESESGILKHRRQPQHQKDKKIEVISRKKQEATVELGTQGNDDDEKSHKIIVNTAERSTVSTQPITTTISNSLVRPESAETTSWSLATSSGSTTSRSSSADISYCPQRDSHTYGEVLAVASTNSSNQHNQNDNNGSDSIAQRGKKSRIHSSAMASTASSRLHRSRARFASTSSIHTLRGSQSGAVTTAATVTRSGTSRTSRSNNSQLSACGGELIDRDLVKSNALRGPQRASSTINAATASSLRRQSSTAGTIRPTLSGQNVSLPKGWIRRTHPDSGRLYFCYTLKKVTSSKMPVTLQHLDNNFVGTSGSSTSSLPVAFGPRRSDTALLSQRSDSSTTSLPKEWVRRTDPITGRLFYVNLVSNRLYAKLPSSVTAAMLNLGREAVTNKHVVHRKKATVPHSPRFTQMSWQRKRPPAISD